MLISVYWGDLNWMWTHFDANEQKWGIPKDAYSKQPRRNCITLVVVKSSVAKSNLTLWSAVFGNRRKDFFLLPFFCLKKKILNVSIIWNYKIVQGLNI